MPARAWGAPAQVLWWFVAVGSAVCLMGLSRQMHWAGLFAQAAPQSTAFTVPVYAEYFAVPLLCGREYDYMQPTLKNLPPSAEHWFGTDMLGRDIFARVCVGGRVSLLIALVCACVRVVVGCAHGGIMTYLGGWVDNIMMRVIECPSLTCWWSSSS